MLPPWVSRHTAWGLPSRGLHGAVESWSTPGHDGECVLQSSAPGRSFPGRPWAVLGPWFLPEPGSPPSSRLCEVLDVLPGNPLSAGVMQNLLLWQAAFPKQPLGEMERGLVTPSVHRPPCACKPYSLALFLLTFHSGQGSAQMLPPWQSSLTSAQAKSWKTSFC